MGAVPKALVFLPAAAVASAGAAAGAAILDPSLDALLARRAPGDFVSVHVQLAEQLDAKALDARMRAAGRSFPERHSDLIVALRDHARAAQSGFLPLLAEEEAMGEITGVRPLWISNAIEMQASPSAIARLIEIFDGAVIYHNRVWLHEPVERDFGARKLGDESREWGLEQIEATTLWEMGIFGQGSIVANLDTGVDGAHVALVEKWRGNEEGVQWWHAWKAEDASDFPFDHDSHGTHTMGSMVGSVPGDTVGVAPAAKWIAARVQLTTPGVSITTAFQWCADPDGDPQTTDDVPDAVSNSWGGSYGCSSYYWSAIDNMEAAGPVAAFSAGNDGPWSETIGSPANRATTHVNCLAVGATNSSEGIANFSSRGPTKCNVADSLKFKPDVVAPGASVRSTIPNDNYASFSGTSMSCPHVGGAIALLRQIMPELPPQELKTLLYRTARHPVNPGSDDNSYGRGIIDLEAAANYLFDEFDLDGYLEGTITDHGSGSPLPEANVAMIEAKLARSPEQNGDYQFHTLAGDYTVATTLWGYHPDTTLVTIPGGGTLTHDVALRELPLGTISGTLSNSIGAGIDASISIYDESNDSLVAAIQTEPDGSFSQAAKIGSYRVIVEPAPPEMFYQVTSVGVDSAQVSDLSATVSAADVLLVDADGDAEDYAEYFLAAIDSAGRSYNYWDRVGQGGAEGATAAMPTSSKVVWFSGDAESAIFSAAEQDSAVAFLNAGGKLFSSGQNIIESIDGGALALHLGIGHEGNTIEHFVDPVDGTALGNAIEGEIFTTGMEPPVNQISQDLLSGGVAAALYGGSDSERALVTWDSGAARAVVAGFGLEGVHDDFPGAVDRGAVMEAVLDYLDGLLSVAGDDGRIPGPVRKLELSQNHPNPFNPSTIIRFALPRRATIQLAVYDARGNRVATLVDGEAKAGRHAVRWNGRNLRGQPVASGVYFYRLDTDDQTLTRRMILVK